VRSESARAGPAVMAITANDRLTTIARMHAVAAIDIPPVRPRPFRGLNRPAGGRKPSSGKRSTVQQPEAGQVPASRDVTADAAVRGARPGRGDRERDLRGAWRGGSARFPELGGVTYRLLVRRNARLSPEARALADAILGLHRRLTRRVAQGLTGPSAPLFPSKSDSPVGGGQTRGEATGTRPKLTRLRDEITALWHSRRGSGLRGRRERTCGLFEADGPGLAGSWRG
jgi:hypothetical protein